jgi:hypothetical protein
VAFRSLVCLSLLVVGFAVTDDTKSGEEGERAIDVAGIYKYGFELSAFNPCDTDDHWQLAGDLTFHGRRFHEWLLEINPKPDRMYNEVFVRIRGVRSDPGSFGHLGSLKYEFTVERVQELRARAPRDCVPERSTPP